MEPILAPPRKLWHQAPVKFRGRAGTELGDRLERPANSQREGVEVEPLEGPPKELGAPFAQEHSGPRNITVRQVVVTDGHLDEALQRLLGRARGAHPERLQELVDLKVEAGVEEGGGFIEGPAQRGLAS